MESHQPSSGLREALHVDDAAEADRDKLMLFGQFVGSWDLDWSGAERRAARNSGARDVF